MGPHFRVRPRSAPRQPARCRRPASLSDWYTLRASERFSCVVGSEEEEEEEEEEEVATSVCCAVCKTYVLPGFVINRQHCPFQVSI